jgi:hypothetical protein
MPPHPLRPLFLAQLVLAAILNPTHSAMISTPLPNRKEQPCL